MLCYRIHYSINIRIFHVNRDRRIQTFDPIIIEKRYSVVSSNSLITSRIGLSFTDNDIWAAIATPEKPDNNWAYKVSGKRVLEITHFKSF